MEIYITHQQIFSIFGHFRQFQLKCFLDPLTNKLADLTKKGQKIKKITAKLKSNQNHKGLQEKKNVEIVYQKLKFVDL